MNLREATPDDYGFIAEHFLRSIREASTHVEDLDNGSVVALLMGLIPAGWTATVVETEGRLIAWAVHKNPQHLAWVFVRDIHRGEGVARWLLGAIGIDYKRRSIVTPFLPNKQERRWKLCHRPFLVLANGHIA